MSDPTIRLADNTPTMSTACTQCGATVASTSPACTVCGTAVTTGGLGPDQGDRIIARLQEKIGDRFKLLELLGRGGMGIVFRALETALDREVALKVLAIDPIFDPDAFARFEREAKLAARLDHPNIVPIFTVGSHESVAYYTMRLVRGGSVEDMIDGRRPLDLPRILGVLRDVAAALDYAHRSGVVHRDIKPANILIAESGHACVADFGIAKALGRQDSNTGTAVIGSPAYMSPEQWRGDSTIDGRADQYALAVVAFELLAGRRPFMSQSPQDLLAMHCTDQVPDITVLRPELDPSVGEAIARAMAKRSSERFGSVSAFVESLAGRRPAAGNAAPHSIRVRRYQPPPPKPRRWKKMALFLAMTAAAAGGWFAPQTAPQVRPAVQHWLSTGSGYLEVILSGLQPAPAVADTAAPAAAAAMSVPDDGDATGTADLPGAASPLDSGSAGDPAAGETPAEIVRAPLVLERPPLDGARPVFRPVARHGFIRIVVRGGAAPVLLNGERAGITAGPAGEVIRAGEGTHFVTVGGAGDLFMPSQIPVTVTLGDTVTAVFSAATTSRPRPAAPAGDSSPAPATPPTGAESAAGDTSAGT